ncbi:MAG: hypothetical protein B6I36_09695 [Desulfobacteraceae bacterium 4572_35.1]|nr:MAG: hypothetical protein B6I36_09695 [Desulfobacteraceae bacterium 4572_35.1]
MRSFLLLLASLLFFVPQLVVAQTQEPLFTPHIERHSNGYIDWDQGVIYSTGRAYAENNRGSRAHTTAAARLVAAANIVKLASRLTLDDRHTMEKLGNGTFVLKLQAFLRYREKQRNFVGNVSHPYADVTLATPLRGVEGLTAKLLTQLKKHPLQWQKFPLPDPRTRQTGTDDLWLVVDTRHLPKTAKLQPCLFPKISSSNGHTLYDLNQVYQSSATQRGMARYVHSSASVEEIMLSLTSPKTPQWQLWARWLNPIHNAWAGTRSRRPRYIVTSAQQVRGITRTNLVISNYDAQRLRQEDMASKILKNCRVIIITSAPIGGIEGCLTNDLRLI